MLPSDRPLTQRAFRNGFCALAPCLAAAMSVARDRLLSLTASKHRTACQQPSEGPPSQSIDLG